MTPQKMTLHRALSELKLIDSKIHKKISVLIPVGINQKGKPVDGIYEEQSFRNDVAASYKSITDLIARKNKIKSAIVLANSKTIVKIGDDEMTISEAINYKDIIEHEKYLIRSFQEKFRSKKADINKRNEEVNKVALNNAQIMLGKHDQEVKPTDNDVEKIMIPYIERMEFHLVDPLGVEYLIEEKNSKIEEFESEIDAVLSEINAITTIEI